MGALAKLQARIHELEKLNEQLSVWKPREKLSRTLELSNLVSRYNALAEAKAHPDFAYRPETGEEQFHSFAGVPIVYLLWIALTSGGSGAPVL